MNAYLNGTYRVMRARLGAPSSGVWQAPRPRPWISQLAGSTSGGEKYTEYAFDDGYTYRQFEDGDILIVKSPRSSVATRIAHDNPAQRTAWTAINNDIQTRKSEAAVSKGAMSPETRDSIILASGSALSKIIESIPAKRKQGKKKKKKSGGRGGSSKDPGTEQEASGFPFLPVAIGGSVLLVIGVVALASGGNGNKAPR